jgi:hypothetical protein
MTTKAIAKIKTTNHAGRKFRSTGTVMPSGCNTILRSILRQRYSAHRASLSGCDSKALRGGQRFRATWSALKSV